MVYFKTKSNFIYLFNIICILFILSLSNSDSYAQIEIKMSRSFDDAANCASNCRKITFSYEGNGRDPLFGSWMPRSTTYEYNRGSIGCNNNTATCTRWDFYEMSLYGNVDMNSYAYKQEDGWYKEWKWDCKGSWQRCWYKKGILIRPTCNWDSGYGYSTSHTIGDLKQDVYSFRDALERAKQYCLGLSQTTKCRESCQPTASLYVNGNLVSTIEGFLDALTKEQAVNGLIKKIGTNSMLELYDPNKIY